MSASPTKQGGFALVAALFVLVVLAGIGAFAVRANVTQQNATDLALSIARTESALHTGVEYAAARLAPPNDCTALPALPAGLNLPDGSTATFTCTQQLPAYTVNGVTLNVFTVNVTAAQGAYGAPGFVCRTITGVRVVN